MVTVVGGLPGLDTRLAMRCGARQDRQSPGRPECRYRPARRLPEVKKVQIDIATRLGRKEMIQEAFDATTVRRRRACDVPACVLFIGTPVTERACSSETEGGTSEEQAAAANLPGGMRASGPPRGRHVEQLAALTVEWNTPATHIVITLAFDTALMERPGQYN